MFKTIFTNQTVRLFFIILLFSVPVSVFLVLYISRSDTDKSKKTDILDKSRYNTEIAKEAVRRQSILNGSNKTDNISDDLESVLDDLSPSTKNADNDQSVFFKDNTFPVDDKMFVSTEDQLKARREHLKKRDELDTRLLEGSKKRRLLADAIIGVADGEIDFMLSVLNTMTPEQMKYAREESLKVFPRDQVEELFNDLSNGPKKSSDEIKQDARNLLKSLELYKIAKREIDIEYHQLLTEMSEFYGYDFFNISNP